MLRQRSLSSIGVVLFAAVPAFIGGAVFLGAMLLIALAALREVFRAFQAHGHRPFAVLGYLALIATMVLISRDAGDWLIPAVVMLFVLSALANGVARLGPAGTYIDWALTIAATLYVALPLAYGVALRGLDGESERAWVRSLTGRLGSAADSEGLSWLAVALSVTWLTDSAAYLAGRAFGKTKLIPALSPGKTRVGAATGVAAGTLAGPLAAWVFGAPMHVLLAAAIGFALSCVGQVGDLGESLIKRNLGIKDMGALIPGHGGLLDRIDALLFTLPVLYFVVRLLRSLGWV